ncbi:MAG TPA: response regulator [Ramlibacter sp.]|uniref:response regulator n=1 Tax=Ramlibacter sp. TaxID=1917967 RepID=UPI002ED31688
MAATTSRRPALPASSPSTRWRSRAARALAALALLFGSSLALAAHEEAEGGVLDLTAPGATARIHSLRGEWAFAWQAFVDPQFGGPLTATAAVGRSWNDVVADGKTPGPDGYATYQLQVRCPAGEQLALVVPMQRSAMQLYVNGRLVVTQGFPGATADTARPTVGRRAVLTDPFPCPLRITAHVSNFSHRAGGFVRPPVAGPIDELARDYKQRLALDTILLGAYLVLGISPVFFFLARPKEKEPLLFGLFCLAQAVYADMTGERLLLQLAGTDTPWEIYLKLEYLSWFASMALFAALVDRLFPRTLRRPVVRGFVAICLLLVLVAALTPGRVYSHTAFFGQGLGVAMGLYVTAMVARVMRQGRKDAGVLLAGMAFLLAALAANLVQFHADVTQRGIIAFGLLAFVLSPAIVMLRRLARALTAEERRSEEQRGKVDLLVRATHAGILDWDYTRNLTRYSPRLLEIMGHPPGTDTSDWPVFIDLIDPRDRDRIQDAFLQQLRDRSVRGGEMKHAAHEYRLMRGDGSPVWVHADAISLRGGDGRTLRYICSFHDVTDQRRLAEGLQRQNEALAENARLREDVERMSRHDLKTPLNSIIGVARLLREDAAVPPEHRELLTIAERAGYRMLEMVNLSLDLSRMELGTYDFKPQAVNLVDVAQRVLLDLQGLAEAARVRIRVEQPQHGPVYARAEELLCYSILANLVKNAIEAAPPGGTVTMALEAGDPLRVLVRNPGRVPATVASRFFDKYATAGKSGGTGLGTYSARLMARVQEGELEMDTGDAGTVLTLTLSALGAEPLPPPREAQADVAARPAVSAADFAPRRVLLVDDDEYNRVLLLRYLPSPPFTVETAAHGQAALDAVARQWPDIVLIDMEMPVLDGTGAVQRIRAREAREGRRACTIVMMSSNDDADSIARGLAAGSNLFLTKPFTREALLAALHDLEERGAGPSTQVPLELPLPTRAPQQSPVPAGAPVRVDPELLAEVPAFLASRRQMVEAMAGALAAGDRKQLRGMAHRAAGGLALFGFAWAAWQSRAISARAPEADAVALRQEIERLREHLASVQVV